MVSFLGETPPQLYCDKGLGKHPPNNAIIAGKHECSRVRTANFGFMDVHDTKLVQLGALAERYFREDPPTCLFKVRQFAELIAKLIAAHHALYVRDRETFEERLRRLQLERIIPREVTDIFHHTAPKYT
jgi:hypothetical protein